MDSSYWFDTINFEWSIVYIEGPQVIFQKNIFLSLKIIFHLENSVDPDEMPHHLGYNCLSKKAVRKESLVCKG